MPVPLLGADELVEIFRIQIFDWHSTVLLDSWQDFEEDRVGTCGSSSRALRPTSLTSMRQLVRK
jgi:hypothetical protein